LKIEFLGVWDTVGALGAPYGLFLGYLSDKIFGCRFHDIKLSNTIQSASHAISLDEHRWPFRPSRWKLQPTHTKSNFLEQWFPGVHSDVGGGYKETGLSDVALNWMAQQANAKGLKSLVPSSSSPSITHDSQTWYYQLPTLLAVKWPAMLLVDIPSKMFKGWSVWIYKKLNDLHIIAENDIALKITKIQSNGDYKRKQRVSLNKRN
jgi:hypothetical protein